MIEQLRIKNLGVIRDATLDFSPGLTVLTGETGAGKTMVGEKHAEVAWLVLQHSGQDDLKLFLPLIKKAYQHGEIDPICYAKSKDRVLIGDRKPQLFGTQLYFNIESQSYAIYQIKNKNKPNNYIFYVLHPLKNYW